jgi:hypothetical protein
MKKIPPGYITPSAAFTIKKNQVCSYQGSTKPPDVGDVIYGKVVRLGHHQSMENRSGRIHKIHVGSKALFVFGNRYAPDHYEGIVPEEFSTEVDLLARSGVVGVVRCRNSILQDPTRIKVLGYVHTGSGQLLNTRDYPAFRPTKTVKDPRKKRAKLILITGTAMNSGKSVTAAACCWALAAMGYDVRASKVTGTASLKDVLHMNDAGATIYNDFTSFGYPSTYLCDESEVLRIFNETDLKYGNTPSNYWVVELADGILQRETAMLLASEDVQSRIHRLIFCAGDALGAVGGLQVLKERFGLEPDAISGVCSSAPLACAELTEFTSVPVFDNLSRDLNQMSEILV